MIALVALILFFHQAALVFARRRFDPFDVRVLMDVVLAVMWIYAPLQNDSLRTSIESDFKFGMSVLLGILALYAGVYFPPLIGFRGEARPVSLVFPEKIFRAAGAMFIIGCCYIVYERTILSGISVVDYALGDRLSGYRGELNDGEGGGFLGRLFVVSHPIMLLWLGVSVYKREWKKALGIYLVVIVGLLFVAVVRLPIIITLTFGALLLYRRTSVAMRSMVLPVTVLAFVVLMSVLNVVRSAGVEGLDRSNFSAKSAASDVGGNMGPLRGYEVLWGLHELNALKYENGLAYAYVPLTAVPRVLWPEKPLVSFEPRWTMVLFGSHYAVSEEGWGVWTFTAWGEGLVQFGLPGVVLNLFLYGLLVGVADRYFKRDDRFLLLWFYYAVLCATYLRSSFSALAWTLCAMYLPVWIMGVIGRRRAQSRRGGDGQFAPGQMEPKNRPPAARGSPLGLKQRKGLS